MMQVFLNFPQLVQGFDAQTLCEAEGMTLARVDPEESFQFIVDADAVNAWVGIVDNRRTAPFGNNEPGRFEFVDGVKDNIQFIHTSPNVFPWVNGEPDNVNNGLQDFVILLADGFADFEGSLNQGYICRKPCNLLRLSQERLQKI